MTGHCESNHKTDIMALGELDNSPVMLHGSGIDPIDDVVPDLTGSTRS